MTTYRVTLTDGREFRLLEDGVREDLVSIPLVGFNVDGYGNAIATAQLRMLENFNSTTAPRRPLRGQLWHDRTVNKVKVWEGSVWRIAGEAPPLSIDNLDDVQISNIRDGQLLRFRTPNGIWKNQRYDLGFIDLLDTPDRLLSGHYLQVNPAGTQLTLIRRLKTSDFEGTATMSQLPLEALCQWLRSQCYIDPESPPIPPPPTPEPTPEPPIIVDIISGTSHIPGSCTVPTGSTICAATGQATVSVDTQVFRPQGPVRYLWEVTDGGPPFLVRPGASGVYDLQTETTVPSVATYVTGSGGQNITRRLNVTVLDTGRPIGRRAVASAPVPDGTYQFREVSGVQTFTATVRINGLVSNSRDGFSYSIVGLTSGATSVTAPVGTAVTITITRADSRWNFTGVSGCSQGDLETFPPNRWAYTFVIPGNNCSVDIETVLPQQDYILRTQIPQGWTITPDFTNGVRRLPAQAEFFEIARQDPTRRLVTVTGCNGESTLVPLPSESEPGPWSYNIVMPEADCTVRVTDGEVSVEPDVPTFDFVLGWDGVSRALDVPPFAQEQFDDTVDLTLNVFSNGEWSVTSVKGSGIPVASGTWYTGVLPGPVQVRAVVTVNEITNGITVPFGLGEIPRAGYRTFDQPSVNRRGSSYDTGWVTLTNSLSVVTFGGWSSDTFEAFGIDVSLAVSVRLANNTGVSETGTIQLRPTMETGAPMIAPL